MSHGSKDSPALFAAIGALSALIFAADYALELGVAVWIFYFAPLLLSLFSHRPSVPMLVAVAVALLTAWGTFVGPGAQTRDIEHIAIVNRSFVVVVFVAFGLVGRSFIRNKVQLLEQEWIKEGRAGLSLALQGEQSPEAIGENALSFLARYVEAQVGSIWVTGEAGLVRRATFAGGPREDSPEVVRLGETLVGQVAADARTLVVNDVPDDYVEIRSGVGGAKPRSLILVPLTTGERVKGVVELGFLVPPPPSVRALLEAAAGVVAVAIRSSKLRQRQAELLEETQRQAEELRAQQEELQATNQELDSRGRALEELNEKLQEQQAEVEEMNTALEESNAELEHQADVLRAQKEDLAATRDILQRTAADLERANQYKSEFLANMSHELRTPLNSTLILAKLLADNKHGNLTPEQVQFATNIHSAGNDLLALINDILDLSKIEAGKLELTFEPVELAPLLGSLRERFEPLAADKKLTLSVVVEPECAPSLVTDSLRLQQILGNLLSNAVKFTEKGSVCLRAKGSEPGRVLLSVEDTGIGIAPHQQEVIFEAFRQADGTTHRTHGGTGLGLSISRELAHLVGGEIGLESTPGKGSKFTLTLPIAPRPTVPIPKREGRARAPAASGGNGRSRAQPPIEDDRGSLTPGSRVVLVIEDDPVFAGILRDLGRELGFKCVVASDAAAGLSLARELAPLAITLDLELPDQPGLSLLDLLKHDPATRHIPVHVVSAHDYQQIAREMGAVGYALKPVKREELVAAFGRLEARNANKSRKVLLVADDPSQGHGVEALLGSDGVALSNARSAGEALERLGSESFDCVVLDLMELEPSGFELLDAMSTATSRPSPPVIVYTARALSLEEERRLRKHAKSIIVKGARSPERLLEEVTLFLHQAEGELPADKRELLRSALDREAIFVGRKILIVEDDVRNIFALTSALEPKGATVEIARNGQEALERLRAGPPIDLVVMDIMMPVMDGLTATRLIRQEPRWANLPIIALTAKAMPNDRTDCLAAGANDYVAKPMDIEKFVSLLRVWMPR